ncbi:(2Fe-2S) ferredoxin domain-containing protein [Nocardioides sp. Kera G14]|uniref:(2Fe-2S) ferredoxin domain-containing protein n=1 Tax=Nocardioides sp. Kera G14 TaxID=2884264 RepID=UPI001D12858E|nr:(2Fe-2S) ferredoxin domain-containing protein [Nocardioides sp. Kera G14]UDY25032.1 (2Fe-2S) ferredoxin domain-containing protein [Nocardioides sp. Kera G14]
MNALVLVGMSVSDVDRRDLLTAEAARRGGSVAFLQMGDPSLSRELTEIADDGATTITLVGVNTGPIGPAHSWLRRIAAHWWRERAGLKPTVYVATRLASQLDQLDDVLTETKPIGGDEPGLTSAAWEDVTGHRHQVMICRGPRCTAKGAEDNLRAMILSMMEHQLGDADVLLVHTGCQFPCNQAPVISVQPDDVWYGHVDAETSSRIVESHFRDGVPVDTHRLPR